MLMNFLRKYNTLYLYFIYIRKNGHTDVCLFDRLLVCGGLMEILILIKFCTHISTSPRKVLIQV